MSSTVDIVYPVCCEMDIHKSSIVTCIATTDELSTFYIWMKYSQYLKEYIPPKTPVKEIFSYPGIGHPK